MIAYTMFESTANMAMYLFWQARFSCEVHRVYANPCVDNCTDPDTYQHATQVSAYACDRAPSCVNLHAHAEICIQVDARISKHKHATIQIR